MYIYIFFSLVINIIMNTNEIYDRERNSSTNNISDDQQGSSEKVINIRDRLRALHTWCHYTYYRY